jgi:hypothetical protein
MMVAGLSVKGEAKFPKYENFRKLPPDAPGWGSYREPDFTGSGIDYCASRLPNAAIMRRITARIDAGMVSIIVIADGP